MSSFAALGICPPLVAALERAGVEQPFRIQTLAVLHRSGRTARAGQVGTVATFVLWDQLDDVARLQKRLRLAEPVVEVFSNDPRLSDLASVSSAVSIAS